MKQHVDTSLTAFDLYDLWSTRVFIMLMISYTMYFLVRQNLALAVPFIEQSLRIDKTQIGTIMTTSMLVFSVGKFICGFYLHLLSPKIFLSLGLVGSSLMNILFSQGYSPMWLTIIWSFNAAFQSLAWPQCIRLMNDWCSQQQLGTRWGLVSLSYQIGSFVVFSCFTFLIEWYGWRASFLVPGLMGILAGLLILTMPLETPSALGLSSREERFGIVENHFESAAGQKESSFWGIAKEVLCNRQIWYISFALFFLYVVKTGFCFWVPTYLTDCKHLNIKTIGTYMIGFEGAGAIGGLAAGWLSDTIFNGRRGPVAFLYFLGIIIFLLGLWIAPGNVPLMDAFLLGGLGFVLTGPQVMAGTATFDFSSKKAAVAANGFSGLFSGLGSALVSGAFLGFIAQFYGWSMVFLLLAGCSVVAAYFFWKLR